MLLPFNTPLEMPISSRKSSRGCSHCSFNTPLEMHGGRREGVHKVRRYFQYSIGDALYGGFKRKLRRVVEVTFNTPLEMLAMRCPYDSLRNVSLSILHWRCRRSRRGIPGRVQAPNFQYSIGDATTAPSRLIPTFQFPFNTPLEMLWRYADLVATVKPTSFNTPLEMPNPLPPAVHCIETVRLSILHWRCGGWSWRTIKSGGGSFNTPLEMLFTKAPWRVVDLRQLSILHWRCATYQNGSDCVVETFNTPLEMLQVKDCNEAYVEITLPFQYSIGDAETSPVDQPLHGDSCYFQYSIGDAVKDTLKRVLERAQLSILHWRCPARALALVDVSSHAFNTPLEMLPHNAVADYQRPLELSILHWRCGQRREERRQPQSLEAFNTPLEMRCWGACPPPVPHQKLSILHWRCSGQTVHTSSPRASAFNTPLEMHEKRLGTGDKGQKKLSILHWRCSYGTWLFAHLNIINFQYSIGDAGGSCRWLLRVFKFC